MSPAREPAAAARFARVGVSAAESVCAPCRVQLLIPRAAPSRARAPRPRLDLNLGRAFTVSPTPELSVPRGTLPARPDTGEREQFVSMEMQAWTSLYHAMHATEERRPFSRVTLRRIAGFARPHQAKLTVFLLLSVVGAGLAVATPVLAGRVVDVIVGGGAADAVVRLALLIAAIAVAEAVVGILTRWYSARIGEGLILDLRD